METEESNYQTCSRKEEEYESKAIRFVAKISMKFNKQLSTYQVNKK